MNSTRQITDLNSKRALARGKQGGDESILSGSPKLEQSKRAMPPKSRRILKKDQ